MININYSYLLKGLYEAERLPKDFSVETVVPGYAFNVLNPLGLLYRPVVDEHYLENGGEKPVWPEGKPFAVCLTHDVDEVSLATLKQSFRAKLLQLATTKSAYDKLKISLGFASALIKAYGRRNQRDPLHCYETWLNIEKEAGARSTFFFWPGLGSVSKRHDSDCLYELHDSIVFDNQKCSIAEMIQEIDCRGWEIGLHPSWYSVNDINELKRQKESLENVIGHEIVSVRQHYLHYDIRTTPKIHTAAGFKYDSTLGFNDNIGFRFGTCYPWNLHDLEANEALSILEIPLIIQDTAMLGSVKGMSLDEDTSFQYVVQIIQSVEKVGGILTVLWHPNYIIRPEWWNLYLRILQYLKSKNAWFGSVQEVGSWWQAQKMI
jgi:peptidoglycan/xylan/chitin deacetylase (PgdA/CDA1 family)